MKTKKIFTVIILILSLSLFCQNKNPRYTGQTIEEIVKSTESEIDIGLASLILAKEFYPDIDINYYLNIIDGCAFNVLKISKQSDNPEIRIGSLNTFLYKSGNWNGNLKFEYNLDDLSAESLESKFLNCYLDKQLGSCITMPLLYIAIAQRLEWPIYGVVAPTHIFCRYEDDAYEFNNIESTINGGHISNEEYKAVMDIPAKAIEQGVYLRTLTNKELLSHLLCVNAFCYFEINQIDKALKYLKMAIDIDNKNAGAYWNYSIINNSKIVKLKKENTNDLSLDEETKNLKKEVIESLSLLTAKYKKRAIELGLTNSLPNSFYKKQKSSINKHKMMEE